MDLHKIVDFKNYLTKIIILGENNTCQTINKLNNFIDSYYARYYNNSELSTDSELDTDTEYDSASDSECNIEDNCEKIVFSNNNNIIIKNLLSNKYNPQELQIYKNNYLLCNYNNWIDSIHTF